MTAPTDLDALIGGEDESFPDATSESTAGARSDANTPQFQGRGPLLEETDEKKIAETITKWLRDQSKARKRRRVIVAWIKQCLKGVRGLQIRPSNEDITELELYRAHGMPGLNTIMARARQLIERVISHLLSDDPAPEAEPEDDSDMAKEAAEVSTRILTIEGTESGFNLGGLLRRALRKSAYHGSGFLYPCVDPAGGGWRPMQVEALPDVSPEQPRTVETATLDPATGAPVQKGDPRLKLRYVKDDQTLTDNPAEAARQWMPKMHVEVLTPDHVAFLPESCSGIAGATGVIIIRYPQVSEARAKFKKFAALDDADIKGLLSWRPDEAKNGQPFDSNAEKLRISASNADGKVDDSARLCTLSLYFKSHPAYPTGAYIVVCGDKVLHKQTWSGMVEEPTDDYSAKNVVEECLEIPLAQLRGQDDDEDDDPMGRPFARELCEIDDHRAYILDAWEDYLDRLIHPYTFVPLGSTINAKQLQMRTGEPLYFNPQGKPEMEQAPPFPADGKEFFDRTTQAGDDSIGIQGTGAGQEVANVKSGVHAAVEVQQSNLNLSTLKHATADCTERFWRIVLQHWRVFYTIEQQAKYLGDDESWRTTEWSRADLGSTRVVRIKPGTFTQMTAEQKEQKALVQVQNGVIDPSQAKDIITSGVRPALGMKTDPAVVRVRRQISLWDDGPPENWQPPQPVQQQGVGPDGMPMMQIVTPPDPANPFADQRMVDADPVNAAKRYDELARHQNEARYIRQPQPWRAYFDAELQKARMEAGRYTLAEQQQAAQAQAQQQAANENENAEKDRSAKAESQQSAQQHKERTLEIAGRQKMEQTHAANAGKADLAARQAQQLTATA